ncbi:hypothetical protein AB0L10_41665 [Streptomyces flaveolus]|uniref:hypothetical protein n=1 Tax=Streptomyces flaveolus TaxID=67297 RepID=UPI0034440BD2
MQRRYKIRRRDTTEGVIGGITGTLSRPQSLLLGRADQDGILRPVARSTELHPEAAQHLAELLVAAGSGHPWEGPRFTASWSRTPLAVVLVEPDLVAEMEVDTAQDRGAWRRPVRFARLRDDMAPQDVPAFGQGTVPPAAG